MLNKLYHWQRVIKSMFACNVMLPCALSSTSSLHTKSVGYHINACACTHRCNSNVWFFTHLGLTSAIAASFKAMEWINLRAYKPKPEVLTKKCSGLQIRNTGSSENLVYWSCYSAAANLNKDSEIAACCSIGSQIDKLRNWGCCNYGCGADKAALQLMPLCIFHS